MPKFSRNVWIVIIILLLVGAWWWFTRSAAAQPGGSTPSVGTSSLRELASDEPQVNLTRRFI